MNFKLQKIKLLALALSLTSWYGCATAPQPQTASAETAPAKSQPAADVGAQKAIVKERLDSFFHAVDVRDWKTVEDVLAPDFEFYGDDLMVLSRDEFLKAMRDDNMTIDKFELKDVKVSLSPDGQMAWVKYHARMESRMRSGPYNMESAETVAFRKEDGSWKMTHNHASVKKLDSGQTAGGL